jgi:hypothetical protein
MKIKGIVLSIILVLMTTAAFGQLSFLKDRLLGNHNKDIVFITVDYRTEEECSKIEEWMHDLKTWAGEKLNRDINEAPQAARIIYLERLDVVYENELCLESWMTAPFETGTAEEDVSLESWMTAPFETGAAEEDVSLESWMTAPFETGAAEEDVSLESWMTAPFV